MSYRQIPVVPCAGGTLYTIMPGDSYFGLAQRFSTTVAALISANPGVNPQNLMIGQQICILVPPTGGPCPGGFTYVIRSGDTYYAISRRFGIVVPALIAANPGVDPNRLFIGQVICVPGTVPATCPGGVTYVIVAGDTLYSIARRYNISIDALFAANPGINPQALQIGQVICIPR